MRLFPLLEAFPHPLIFWSTCASWIVPEMVAWFRKRAAKSSTSHDQGSLILISILWCAGIVFAFLFAIFLPQADISQNRSSVFFVGIGLMLMGVGLRWYSANVLGKYFTFDVAIERAQVLIDKGPYRYLRHPSYSGALLTLLGFGLALGNWASAFAGVSCLALAYGYRIPIEEAALTAALGDAYKQYANRTWRLVPFLF